MSSSCHFAVYWTYSLLHQCFMPNRYISLFKMYLTLLTSQRGALATDAKSCSLWRSLLERPPPALETRVRDPLGVMVRTRGGLTISSAECSSNQLQVTPAYKFLVILQNLISWIRYVWLGLELNCAEVWPSRKWDWDQCSMASWSIFIFKSIYLLHLYYCKLYIYI